MQTLSHSTQAYVLKNGDTGKLLRVSACWVPGKVKTSTDAIIVREVDDPKDCTWFYTLGHIRQAMRQKIKTEFPNTKIVQVKLVTTMEGFENGPQSDLL